MNIKELKAVCQTLASLLKARDKEDLTQQGILVMYEYLDKEGLTLEDITEEEAFRICKKPMFTYAKFKGRQVELPEYTGNELGKLKSHTRNMVDAVVQGELYDCGDVQEELTVPDCTQHYEDEDTLNKTVYLLHSLLTPMERRVITLRYFEEMTLKQVSNDIRKPLTTVFELQKSGLKKLREGIE